MKISNKTRKRWRKRAMFNTHRKNLKKGLGSKYLKPKRRH